jgi:hypothetical protein
MEIVLGQSGLDGRSVDERFFGGVVVQVLKMCYQGMGCSSKDWISGKG